jgi:predicted flap endonuclease-1-like 5' DNA nuclease
MQDFSSVQAVIRLVVAVALFLAFLDRVGLKVPRRLRWILVALVGFIAVGFPREKEEPDITAPARSWSGEAQTKTARVSAASVQKEVKTSTDNLTMIEGIGPKMESALAAAGINSFNKLARASEDELRAAISNAGLRLAPSLTTWAEQAAYAARGDWDGLKTFQQTLTGGRKNT